MKFLFFILYSWLLFLLFSLLFNINRRVSKLEEANLQQLDTDKKDDKIIYYPTAEHVNVSILLYSGVILYYLFPNSFKDANEAIEYYKKFSNRAKELGEDEQIYNIPYTYNLDLSMDFLSGNIIFYNNTTKIFSAFGTFNLFHYSNLKSNELKKDIEKLLKENIEHLKNTGLLYVVGSGKYLFVHSLAVLPSGIYPWRWRDYSDYHECNVYWEKNIKNFTLPFEEILTILRIVKTYDLSIDYDSEQISNIENKLLRDYPDIKYTLNYKNNSAKISNKFMTVDIKVNYFRPVDKIEYITPLPCYSPHINFWSN